MSVPTPLAYTTEHVLKFEPLRYLLRGYAPPPLGQAKVALLVASSDRDWIDTQHRLTTEIREFRRVGGHFEFSGLLDVGQSVEKARIAGAALETGEIRDIVLVVDRAAEWREIELNPPSAMTLEWKAVAQISTGIVDFTDFLRAFRNKIRPDGTLEDRASPELARIRRDIEKQKRALQDSLRAYLRRLAEEIGRASCRERV